MANMNIRTPRFYVDWISHLLARGVSQNGNFESNNILIFGPNKFASQLEGSKIFTKKICEKYRGKNGNDYDCAIAVSGGKDSHFQTYIIRSNTNKLFFLGE